MGDMRLVARMLSGDTDSFDDFFARYFPVLYRFALTRLDRDTDATEDVVQATLCRAVDKLHTYRGEAALLTWLCTLCRHEISDYCDRRRIRAREHLLEDAPEVRAALEALSAADSDRPDVRLGRRELARLVQVVLDRLPHHYGDALEWKYVHGLSVREIADRLAIGPKAAESLLTRARGAFREGFAALTEGAADVGVPVSWNGPDA